MHAGQGLTCGTSADSLGISTPRYGHVSRAKIITLSPRAGRKCSICLDLSIVTILITPECCQPARLGGSIDSRRLID